MANSNFRHLPIYKEIMSKANSIGEMIGLDDISTSTLREFVVDIAHSQYQAGNKAGIAWVRGGMKKAAQTS